MIFRGSFLCHIFVSSDNLHPRIPNAKVSPFVTDWMRSSLEQLFTVSSASYTIYFMYFILLYFFFFPFRVMFTKLNKFSTLTANAPSLVMNNFSQPQNDR
eukprot:TRINITY_DN3199_c0_g1_i6.p1 TRINITY_DN3199_c0_g1~~TRINITY_DN3199_c0_g1_i6.p1  ORF type:complete len:100 (-),score=8.64 TRINITY_DN3199_c0_g1_i6:77-376(-)